jgi:hypothetical protein
VAEMNAFQASLSALAAGTAFAIPYTVAAATADADPGAGNLRFDNFAAQTAATVLRLDLTDSAGANQTTVLDAFDDSTSLVKGQFRLVKLGAPSVWLAGSITALASPAGYRNVTVTGLSGSSAAPFVAGDGVVLLFTRTGDQGAVGSSNIAYTPRAANVQLVAADFAAATRAFIDATGTFTQTFAAVATIGAGGFLYYRNNGTGDITLDPNGAETIDGLASFVMYPGEARLIHCDGAAFRSIVLHPFSRTMTSSGSFVKPPGYQRYAGLLWPGGGSGAKSTAGGSNSATGGSGGACVPFSLPASALAATETVTIAAAVTGPSISAVGVNGNNSTFGALVTAYGGQGGLLGTTGMGGAGVFGVGSGATGGAPNGGTSGGDAEFGGGGGQGSGPGGRSVYGGGASGGGSGAGGNSMYGGAGGGSHTAGAVGAGGTSAFGGNGGAAVALASGVDGSAPAGGGGATNAGAKAGDGARGECRIWGIA